MHRFTLIPLYSIAQFDAQCSPSAAYPFVYYKDMLQYWTPDCFISWTLYNRMDTIRVVSNFNAMSWNNSSSLVPCYHVADAVCSEVTSFCGFSAVDDSGIVQYNKGRHQSWPFIIPNVNARILFSFDQIGQVSPFFLGFLCSLWKIL